MTATTQRMNDCLQFLKTRIAANGYAPSMEEICIGLGLSPKSKAYASAMVRCLEERGAVHVLRKPSGIPVHRGVTLVCHACPHCGGNLDQTPKPAAA